MTKLVNNMRKGRGTRDGGRGKQSPPRAPRPAPLFLLAAIFVSTLLSAQTTKDPNSKGDPASTAKTKILIVPWEPRMFNCNSDISRAISNETSQKYGQVQEALRKGMVEQLKRAFGSDYNVVSLIDDTAKMKGDLNYVYNYTSMSYVGVNSPLNPTKEDSARMKQQTGLKNGQVAVQAAEGEKFMTTVVLSPNLLAYLKKKYKADYVLFLNQVDLENDLGADPYNTEGKSEFNRKAAAHWTIFSTSTGKRVAMGKNKGTFSSTTNTPKKIIDGAFAMIAKAINEKFVAALKP